MSNAATSIAVTGGSPAELDAFLRKEIPPRAEVIKDNNIKAGD